MKNIKKNTFLYLTFVIIFLLIIVLAATYAYFSTELNNNANLNVDAEVEGNRYEFLTTSSSPITLNITPDLMSQTSSSNTQDVANSVANISVILKTKEEDTRVSCTFDFIFIWDSVDKYINESNDKDLSTGNYPYEFSVLAPNVSQNDYYLSETDLSNLVWSVNNNKYQAKLFTTTIQSGEVSGLTFNYQFITKIYNIDVNQTNLINKSFMAHVQVDNNSIDCTMLDKN